MIASAAPSQAAAQQRAVGGAPDPAPAAESPAPLRILLFTAVDRDLRGGVATVYRRLSAALDGRGHIVAETWGAQPGHTPGADELPLAEIHTRFGLPTPTSAVATARFIARLATLLRRHRPRIVNMHFVHARMAQVLLWLRPIFGYKLVLSAHGSDLFDPPAGNPEWLPRVLPRADAIVAVTEPLAARVRAIAGVDPARLSIIPGGIDADLWQAEGDQPLGARHPLVVTVGQLRRVKGHDVLLDAWPRVLAAAPDAKLVIVGDGELRDDLKAKVAADGIAGSVTFAGQQSPEEVRELLHQARLFVLPSRSEALPLALLEAMASGLPVVATAVGGVPDLLRGPPGNDATDSTPIDGAGAVIPPQDPAALAAGITTLLHDSPRAVRLAAAARQRAGRHSAAATAAAYEQLFMELVGEKRSARRGV